MPPWGKRPASATVASAWNAEYKIPEVPGWLYSHATLKEWAKSHRKDLVELDRAKSGVHAGKQGQAASHDDPRFTAQTTTGASEDTSPPSYKEAEDFQKWAQLRRSLFKDVYRELRKWRKERGFDPATQSLFNDEWLKVMAENVASQRSWHSTAGADLRWSHDGWIYKVITITGAGERDSWRHAPFFCYDWIVVVDDNLSCMGLDLAVVDPTTRQETFLKSAEDGEFVASQRRFQQLAGINGAYTKQGDGEWAVSLEQLARAVTDFDAEERQTDCEFPDGTRKLSKIAARSRPLESYRAAVTAARLAGIFDPDGIEVMSFSSQQLESHGGAAHTGGTSGEVYAAKVQTFFESITYKSRNEHAQIQAVKTMFGNLNKWIEQRYTGNREAKPLLVVVLSDGAVWEKNTVGWGSYRRGGPTIPNFLKYFAAEGQGKKETPGFAMQLAEFLKKLDLSMNTVSWMYVTIPTEESVNFKVMEEIDQSQSSKRVGKRKLFSRSSSGETTWKLGDTVQHALWRHNAHVVKHVSAQRGGSGVRYLLNDVKPDLCGSTFLGAIAPDVDQLNEFEPEPFSSFGSRHL